MARKEEENLFQVEWVHFKPGQFPCSGAPSSAPSIVFVDRESGFPAPWAMTVSGKRRPGLQTREWWLKPHTHSQPDQISRASVTHLQSMYKGLVFQAD